jgi:hypothetical protein
MKTNNAEELPTWLADSLNKNAKQSGNMVAWRKTRIANTEAARDFDPWQQLGTRFSGGDIEPTMRSFQSVLNRPLHGEQDPELLQLEASLNQEKKRLKGMSMSSYGRDSLTGDGKAQSKAAIVAFWLKHGIHLK